jgi:hypothetical protein
MDWVLQNCMQITLPSAAAVPWKDAMATMEAARRQGPTKYTLPVPPALCERAPPGQETRRDVAETVGKTEALDEQEARDRVARPAAKAAAEDSAKAEELEAQWHEVEAARAAKARTQN